MIKIKSKRKKNPHLVEYGYHFTKSENITSIMEEGLIPGIKVNKKSQWYEWLSGCQKKLIGYFYNNTAPVYFSDIPNTRNLPETLIKHFNENEYYKCLKVDVSTLNQLPDLFMLNIDYDCQCTSDDNGDYALKMHSLKQKKIKSLNNILERYEYIMPFYVLKNNEELQSELIFLTGTFVVNEKIPPKYIKEIINVRNLK